MKHGPFRVPSGVLGIDSRLKSRSNSLANTGLSKSFQVGSVFCPYGLEQLIQFYNTRNLTTMPGEVINFTEADPYARLKGKPLWPRPEVPDPATLENPTGVRGMIGNLGLTATDVADLIAFLRTLSDDQSGRRGELIEQAGDQ